MLQIILTLAIFVILVIPMRRYGIEEICIDLALGKCSYGICRICNFKTAKHPVFESEWDF